MSPSSPPSDNQFVGTGRSSKGEPWIWLTAGGLSLGILMVIALLSLILAKGVASFWPRQIVVLQVETRDGLAPMAGYLTERSERLQEGGGRVPQIQIFRGNKDLYGESFVYLDQEQVREQEVAPGYMLVERTEYGPAILQPVQLVTPAGVQRAGDEAFEEALRAMISLNQEVREETRHIERKLIGANARAIQEIEVDLRVGKIDPAQAAEKKAKLEKEFARLQAAAAEVRSRIQGYQFEGETAEGRVVTLQGSQLLGFFQPNDRNWFERLWEMLCRMGRFLVEEPREANTEGGVYPAIFGTVVMTLAMTFFVTPLGVIAAIYLREYAKQGTLVRIVRICVNNLAGVPSIVFGVFGLAFFVYFVGASLDELFYADKLPTPTFGTPGILWASLTLALLTLPVVIVATEEALSAVPRGVREAALACGASKWQTIQRIVIPASLPGIMTGIILAMARGAGEVAPLMLVGAVKLAPSLPIDDIAPFVHAERKFMHLGFHIYDLGFQSPDAEAAKPIVYATALLLILLVLVLNLTAILIRNRLKKRFAVSQF
ncbi:MAG: phosphate ABC transporter permease PstA [Verrucomicrobiota bacterium]